MWTDKPATPRINKAFAGIRDVGFLGGNKIGAVGYVYEKVLSEKLNGKTDKQLAAIDEQLALGNYVIRTDAAKLKRRALRAVVLACCVMLNSPGQGARFLQRYKGMGIDDLRNAFFSQFPYVDDTVVRAKWSAHTFTNAGDALFAAQFAQLTDWTTALVPKFRFMVHCVDEPGKWGGKEDPVAELSKYDLTSMTLLDSTKRYTYFNWGGMVFSVPENNIMVTYSHDQMSDTHGPARGDRSQLSLANEVKTLAFGTDGLKSPDEVVKAQDAKGTYAPAGMTSSPTINSTYNEISICGRPDTPLPWGRTGTLKLQAVFSLVPKNGKLVGLQLEKSKEWAKIGQNKKVPMLYIPMM